VPQILPFSAIRYSHAGDLAAVTAPPYDVISPHERDHLQSLDPKNFIHITLGGDYREDTTGGEKYQAAARTFRDWLDHNVLAKDEQDAFWIYSTEYTIDGEARTTSGLVAALELEDWDEGEVLPHERTIKGPIVDRLNLTRAVQANLEPLWFFASKPLPGFKDFIAESTAEPPTAWAVDPDGVRHSIWRAVAEAVKPVQDLLSATPLIVADGHHRYETAIAYRDEMRERSGPGPWDQTLAFIVDPVEYPPALLPIHRLTTGVTLGAEHGITEFEGSVESLYRTVQAAGPGTIGAASQQGLYLLPTTGPLDTRFLAESLLEPSGAEVIYEHDLLEIERAVEAGQTAFLMAAVPIGVVAAMALEGERMPPKTTLFWPKPRSGFVMRDLLTP